jgi:hypothetical protein
MIRANIKLPPVTVAAPAMRLHGARRLTIVPVIMFALAVWHPKP